MHLPMALSQSHDGAGVIPGICHIRAASSDGILRRCSANLQRRKPRYAADPSGGKSKSDKRLPCTKTTPKRHNKHSRRSSGLLYGYIQSPTEIVVAVVCVVHPAHRSSGSHSFFGPQDCTIDYRITHPTKPCAFGGDRVSSLWLSQ